jgi:cytochrome c oxidase cbb3-type subunit 2
VIKHESIETNAGLLIILTLIVISIGGLVEIVPLFYINDTVEKVDGVRPYTALELRGRDIYQREGCYLCHSQMIRPFRDEWLRYGHYSLAAESKYDYPWMIKNDLDYSDIQERMRALKETGVPYSETQAEYDSNVKRFGADVADKLDILHAEENLIKQAQINDYDGQRSRITEMDALVAYLQVLGTMVDFSKYDEGYFAEFR